MIEPSERLMRLFRGGTCARPPYWEPWFRMTENLQARYAGDPLAMALDLGHAAVPLPWIELNSSFYHRVERREDTGVWYAGGLLTRREQLRAAPEPDWDAQRARIEPLRRRCREAGMACWLTLPWCFHAVASSMGLENFALACYDEIDFVREALAFVERRNAQAIEKVVAAVAPDFVLFDGDCAYKTGTMIAPAMMRDLVRAPTLANTARLHTLGVVPVFHSDGKLDDVIPLLLELRFAAVHGCESAANDLAHLVERFGRSIVLCGNMDVVFLKSATPEAIRAAARDMLRLGNRFGRFAAGCNTSPLDYIPWENYRAFVDAVTAYQPAPPAGV